MSETTTTKTRLRLSAVLGDIPIDMKQACPNCGNRNTRRSKRRGGIDRLWGWFHYVPYRCLACRKRFHCASQEGSAQPSRWKGATRSFPFLDNVYIFFTHVKNAASPDPAE